MRAVLDANVFISALIGRNSIPARIFVSWHAGAFDLVMSAATFDEWLDVVRRPETQRFVRRSPKWISTLLAEVRASALFVEPVVLSVVVDDPDDDFIVGTAVAGKADVIVTGDKHLLALGTYEGIRIVTPREFFDLLKVTRHQP